MKTREYNEEYQREHPLAVGFRQEPVYYLKHNCAPTICDNDLMNDDLEFMTKATINKKCMCQYMDTCKAICDLLEHWKKKEAEDLFGSM